MDKTNKWVRIAENPDKINFPENNITLVHIEKKTICILRTSDGLKACASTCPHAGSDLSCGFLDSRDNIVCPVHGYRFNTNNGRDSNNEGYFLKIYPVKTSEDGVFLALE